jgi:hypothetical protein
MAHFAERDIDNVVLRVVAVVDEHEIDGESWCNTFFGGTWKQTSYNTRYNRHSGGKSPLRKNYAGIGFDYNTKLDAFIPPQRYPSWILDEEKGEWESPIPMPTDGVMYEWDEPSTSWIKDLSHG